MASAAGDHISVMEPSLARELTVDFSSLESPEGAARLHHLLAEFGCAIVRGVFDSGTIGALEAAFAADLASIVDSDLSANSKELNFLRDPVQKWPLGDESFDLGTKFVTKFGLPHGLCAWGVRSHPNVKRVYEALYETPELCCGIDTVFFNNRRSAVPNDADRTSNLWPHADLNARLLPQGSYSVWQSVVYLWDADVETSATVVWPTSHKDEFQRLMATTAPKGHFCLLPKDRHPAFLQHGRRVPVPAGGMLLWDSRTIHQGWAHGRRLAVPVCFEPKSRRPPEVLASKEQTVKDGTPTSHWASLGRAHSLSAGVQDGGTSKVRLRHVAHLHCIDPATGNVKPEIAKFL